MGALFYELATSILGIQRVADFVTRLHVFSVDQLMHTLNVSALAIGILLAVVLLYVTVRTCGLSFRSMSDSILPYVGFVFCGIIWVNLNWIAKTVGGIWFVLGIVYVGYKTNWFRSAPVMIDFSDS